MVYADSLLRKVEANDYNLCLTGAAFNSLFRDIEEGEQLLEWEIDLLKSIQIFARTKPSDKAKVVRLYQWMGKIVGMCGDGANDCDALHQANLGLSLSDTEASIAAAFTAKTRHIGSML
jgi:cation-transporting ATPase 13A3/4/5